MEDCTPAVLTHISIGSVYSWSLFNQPLAQSIGMLSTSSMDWGLSGVVPIFSTAICAAGLTAALSGPWAERNGPRCSVFAAGLCWGGGLALSAFGVSIHSLPLVYLGYGVLGGIGVGLAYAPPVATLMRWFPDRKGLASGLAICGFGGGAMIATPVIKAIMESNFISPTYLGTSVNTIYQNGRLEQLSSGLEVVSATAKEILALGLNLPEGYYLAGTGNNGAAAALMALGVAYFSVLSLSSIAYRIPHEGWKPAGAGAGVIVGKSMSESKVPLQHNGEGDGVQNNATKLANYSYNASDITISPDKYVNLSVATSTSQFAKIWMSLFLNTTAGIALLGVAKTLMYDVFGSNMPTIVDAAFCGGYVAALSAFNGVGRLGWAVISDKLGRKNTFSLYFALGIPLYMSIPYSAHLIGVDSGYTPLIIFTSSTLAIISIYGGGFAVAPAYLSDLFGSKDVGSIYGRLLTAWSCAGLVGPTLLAKLRYVSEVSAMKELSLKIDPILFQQKFNLPNTHIQDLIDNKCVTISKLMDIAPIGTQDPTPFLYDSTMMTMSGLLAIGLITNLSMKPVSDKYHLNVNGSSSLSSSPSKVLSNESKVSH